LVELIVIIGFIGFLAVLILVIIIPLLEKGRIVRNIQWSQHLYNVLEDELVAAWNFDEGKDWCFGKICFEFR